MKNSGLLELVGKLVRVRPAVKRQLGDGTLLPSIEDDWRVEKDLSGEAVVVMHNLPTGYVVPLWRDGVFEFREPNTLVLKEQITFVAGAGLLRDPLPDPRARYTPPALRSR